MDYMNSKTKYNERKDILNMNSELDYQYPSLNDLNQIEHTIKETNVSKNLKLSGTMFADPPRSSKTSIGRKFNGTVIPNPIHTILQENKKKINQYQLKLAFSKPKDMGIKKTITEEKTRKRIKQPKYPTEKDKSYCSTPISKRQIMPSPGGMNNKRSNKLTQSTPVAALGTTSENKLNISESRQKKILDKINGKKTISEESNTDYDNLACHADNIMRMAVDSTMLGSTFNGTFSFSFSNTFNDSINAMSSKKNGEFDLFNDEEDVDKSVLEVLRAKRKNGLNKLKAIKIDINAEDLQAAVNDENLL